uniref:ResIII domain-containing protein n=1 Tax=Meloidogyne hapla TaxID=6305 RepID=A0A1I8AZJ0_MELHA
MSPPKDFSGKCIPPRDYQVELLDRAKIQNTIISLGTGAGKTFVAVLLIKEYAQRLLHRNEKAAFLVNTGYFLTFLIFNNHVNLVELVAQQAEHIEFHSSLSVARISGSTIKRKHERGEVEKITRNNQASIVLLKASLFPCFIGDSNYCTSVS